MMCNPRIKSKENPPAREAGDSAKLSQAVGRFRGLAVCFS
jgi:hypothetical protein